MNKNNCTRKDVAKLANVSETVVSYVVNNNRYVAAEKRERVLKAISALNYQPNNIARALKGKGSNHLVFVADKISTEHFGVLVEQMDSFAYEQGYLISLLANRNTPDFVPQLISRRPDGIIVSSVSITAHCLDQLASSNIPVVLLGNRNYANLDSRIGVINTGIKQGVQDGIQHLVQQGCSNIFYVDRVSATGNFSDTDDLRLTSFIEYMISANLNFSHQNIFTGYNTEVALTTALVKQMQSAKKMDGIIARNDNLACLVMNVLQEQGVKIPQQVKVVGFDNSRVSQLVTPKLTTIEIDRASIARGIIDMMNSMISGNQPASQQFNTKLIPRESTQCTATKTANG